MYGSGYETGKECDGFERPYTLVSSLKNAGRWAAENEKQLFMTEFGKIRQLWSDLAGITGDDCIFLGRLFVFCFTNFLSSMCWLALRFFFFCPTHRKAERA